MSRMDTEGNIWFATVRADGRPHLTPIWFVFHDGKVWICTGDTSVKVRNVRANPNVSVALEDGIAPVVAEGTAIVRERPYPSDLVQAFIHKYDWDISRTDDPDGDYSALIEITIQKWLMGSAAT